MLVIAGDKEWNEMKCWSPEKLERLMDAYTEEETRMKNWKPRIMQGLAILTAKVHSRAAERARQEEKARQEEMARAEERARHEAVEERKRREHKKRAGEVARIRQGRDPDAEIFEAVEVEENEDEGYEGDKSRSPDFELGDWFSDSTLEDWKESMMEEVESVEESGNVSSSKERGGN